MSVWYVWYVCMMFLLYSLTPESEARQSSELPNFSLWIWSFFSGKTFIGGEGESSNNCWGCRRVLSSPTTIYKLIEEEGIGITYWKESEYYSYWGIILYYCISLGHWFSFLMEAAAGDDDGGGGGFGCWWYCFKNPGLRHWLEWITQGRGDNSEKEQQLWR